MYKRISKSLVSLFFVFGLVANAEEKPELLVLASVHFSNPGKDQINMEVEDVLSKHRQQGIEHFVKNIEKFEPTHVAVEIGKSHQDRLDKHYQDYLKDEYQLTRSEADQLGLRLAKNRGLNKIYGIDWNGNPPGYSDADFNWHKYAQENSQEEQLAKLTNPARAASFAPELKDQTIGEWFRQINATESLLKSHQVYFDIAMIGDPDKFIGADWVGTWYARNLKIFKNIVDLNAKSGDKIVVIYGQGHAYLLQQFAEESGMFKVVNTQDFLK